MSERHLLGEVDRQLGEQRAQADSYASRAGVLVATTALLAGLLIESIKAAPRSQAAILWSMAISAVSGVVAISTARLNQGLSPSQLSRLQERPINELMDAKLIVLEANARALTRAEVFLFVQAAATILTVILIAVRL